MKFKFAPLGDYHAEQIIDIHGDRYRVEFINESRRSLSAVNLSTNERVLVVLTNAKPIEEVTQ